MPYLRHLGFLTIQPIQKNSSCIWEGAMIKEKSEASYKLSLMVLKKLLMEGLITADEFELIDRENKKSFLFGIGSLG